MDTSHLVVTGSSGLVLGATENKLMSITQDKFNGDPSIGKHHKGVARHQSH